jgi:hypothetical protein
MKEESSTVLLLPHVFQARRILAQYAMSDGNGDGSQLLVSLLVDACFLSEYIAILGSLMLDMMLWW